MNKTEKMALLCSDWMRDKATLIKKVITQLQIKGQLFGCQALEDCQYPSTFACIQKIVCVFDSARNGGQGYKDTEVKVL